MPSEQISLDELVGKLIEYNKSLLDRMVLLMKKVKNDIINTSDAGLQGEAEELLRTILDGIVNTIESLLAIQEQLQASSVESFFPAQD